MCIRDSVSGMLGNYRGNCAWVAPLAWHPTNQNAVIVCDLSGDIDNLGCFSLINLAIAMVAYTSAIASWAFSCSIPFALVS